MAQLTIQLVTWNSASQLRRSLPALQQVDPSIAFVRVIDNGSTDESVALVKKELPRAHIVLLNKNTGFAGGHNEGFARCTTPFVLVLNPDVELVPESLQPLLVGMKDSNVGALQGKLYRHGTTIDSTGVVLTAAFNGRERGAGETDTGQFNEATALAAVTGACALYRVAALQAVTHSDGEVFDNDFWAYKEDVDLGWRLRRAGWKILYLPVTAGTHERSLKTEGALGWSPTLTGIGRRLGDPRTSFSVRNWLWLMAKNATVGEMVRHSPWIMGRGVVLLALSIISWPTARGWGQALVGIRPMIAKRRVSG